MQCLACTACGVVVLVVTHESSLKRPTVCCSLLLALFLSYHVLGRLEKSDLRAKAEVDTFGGANRPCAHRGTYAQ